MTSCTHRLIPCLTAIVPLLLPCLHFLVFQDALKLNESDSMDVSSQVFLNLHQISCTPRGQMIHSDPGEATGGGEGAEAGTM